MSDTLSNIDLIKLIGETMEFQVMPCEGGKFVEVCMVVGGESFVATKVRVGFGIFLRGRIRRAKRRLKRIYVVCDK